MTTERDRLIDAALEHVVFDGMSDKAIAAGARDIGISSSLAHVHLPRCGVDLAVTHGGDRTRGGFQDFGAARSGDLDRLHQIGIHASPPPGRVTSRR